MVIKKADLLLIEQSDPFKHDSLERKQNIEVLTQLVGTITEPYVLSIEAPWGTGKTTFARMWQQHLRNSGVETLYFNAWENDFAEDPLIAFISEIESQLVEHQMGDKSRLEKYLHQVKVYGSEIAVRILPVAAKVLTHGVLDLDDVAEKAFAETIEKALRDRFANHKQSRLALSNFRKTLEQLARELSADTPEAPRPLIMFIDELDRCRPTYAVELLERIKHVFSVPGIVFILVVDRQQLEVSIRSLYGGDTDVDGYLRRFIDLAYQLPQPKPDLYPDFLFNYFKVEDFMKGRRTSEFENIRSFLRVFKELAQIFNLSLRQQEQCFSHFMLILRMLEAERVHPLSLTVVLVVLKAVNRELYFQYRRGYATGFDVIDFFKQDNRGVKLLSDNHPLAAWILSGAGEYREEETKLEDFTRKAEEAGDSEEGRWMQEVARIWKNLYWHNGSNMANTLFGKIEILEHFRGSTDVANVTAEKESKTE